MAANLGKALDKVEVNDVLIKYSNNIDAELVNIHLDSKYNQFKQIIDSDGKHRLTIEINDSIKVIYD